MGSIKEKIAKVALVTGMLCLGGGIGSLIGINSNCEYYRNKDISNLSMRSDYPYLP